MLAYGWHTPGLKSISRGTRSLAITHSIYYAHKVLCYALNKQNGSVIFRLVNLITDRKGLLASHILINLINSAQGLVWPDLL